MFVFPQPQRFETRKLVAGRKDQHQDRRFRYGVLAAQRQHARDQLWFSTLCMPWSHPSNFFFYIYIHYIYITIIILYNMIIIVLIQWWRGLIQMTFKPLLYALQIEDKKNLRLFNKLLINTTIFFFIQRNVSVAYLRCLLGGYQETLERGLLFSLNFKIYFNCIFIRIIIKQRN